MHDAVLVRVREPVHDLDEDSDGVADRQLALAHDALAQRLPRNVRHHEVEQPVRLTGIEQREDARMLELRGDLDLPLKARGADGRGEIVAEHLDRDLAAVPHIVREVDGGHAAGSELALQHVLPGEARVYLRDAVGHGRGGDVMRQDMDLFVYSIPERIHLLALWTFGARSGYK